MRCFSLSLVCLSLVGFLQPVLAEAPLRVTATTTDLAAMARAVGGDRVEVESLVRPLQDPHYLDATPGMVVRLSRSDVVIINGLDLEIGWIPEVLRQTRNRQVRPGGVGFVDASRGVPVIQVPERITRDQGDVHPSGNPHYTLEPVKACIAAENVYRAFAAVDPDHADDYRQRLDAFCQACEAALKKWQEKFAEFEGAGVVVYHRHFDYMLKSLDLEIVDTIEPLPGLAPSARHLARLLDRHADGSVRLVISEPWHDLRVARRVANELGVELVVGCPAVNACEGTGDLISLFEANASRIHQALVMQYPDSGDGDDDA